MVPGLWPSLVPTEVPGIPVGQRAPKARSIPAWGKAPGNGIKENLGGLKARPIVHLRQFFLNSEAISHRLSSCRIEDCFVVPPCMVFGRGVAERRSHRRSVFFLVLFLLWSALKVWITWSSAKVVRGFSRGCVREWNGWRRWVTPWAKEARLRGLPRRPFQRFPVKTGHYLGHEARICKGGQGNRIDTGFEYSRR